MASPLPLEAVVPLARQLAAKEAHWPEDADDLVQVGLWAYHQALRSHQRRQKVVTHPRTLARTILLRAMRGYANHPRQREFDRAFRFHPQRPDVAVTNQPTLHLQEPQVRVPGVAAERQLDLLALGDYYQALERACGPLARTVAENLVEPSHPDIWAYVQQSRKKRRQEGRRGTGKYHVQVTRRAVREGLGLRRSEWHRLLIRIRTFTTEWLRTA